MNDLFNILIFSKDYNQGVIIQDYIKAIGYNSQYSTRKKRHMRDSFPEISHSVLSTTI